jgi:hypothetical protein
LKRTEQHPDPSQTGEDVQGGSRLDQQAFRWLIVVKHHDHGTQLVGISPMAAENRGGEIALQSGEVEAVLSVVPQYQLNEAVAQPTDAIIQDDRVHYRPSLSQDQRGTVTRTSKRD